jgi:hypothetical protein
MDTTSTQTNNTMKNKSVNWFPPVLMSAAALALAGCWTPPNANVQPKAKAGLIQEGIPVKAVEYPATVKAIDAGTRTITLAVPGGVTMTYKAGPKVKHFDQVRVGDRVKATVTQDLAVYVLENGRLPDGATAESLGVRGRVLLVDPSYRLLTVQYADGSSQTFKPGLHTKMKQMEPGDSVVVRPAELTAIKIKNP